ncbi:H+/oligopeptide symporter [Handroanthus impetiginosus]|uniref:H+/oligopeptide symporter n=1 Tax=Handroanthus impetiginosus TaxID=429701 RepID=A0A2G9G943_9LAMI|nr:H+/oligopeptide symporter [Handroanthus impetiginosus]
MAEEVNFTKDGTVDYKSQPANKKKTGTWKACLFILGNQFCERLAYYGMSSNLLLYFTNQLNQHRTNFVMPLVGAFLADAYLGRYWTIASLSIIYLIGMTLLTLSASIPGLRPTCHKKDVCDATGYQTTVCLVALYLVALGTGGIKPCVSSYGADQFDDADEVEKGRKSSFFNWLYFCINIGAVIGSSFLVWIQVNIGWAWGFGVPTIAVAVSVAFFLLGTQLYRYQKPGGSPLTRVSQVVMASLRKYHVKVPEDRSILYETQDAESLIVGSRKLEHTEEFRFFDKAAVEIPSDHTDNSNSINPWRLCTVTQVEELKGIVRLLPVWATCIIFNTVFGQMWTLFLLQAEYMDIRLGKSGFKIPEASLSTFDHLGVILWIPIYDRFIVPIARKFTGHKNGLTQLQRIGAGLFISIFAMISAAILEIFRLRIVKKHNMRNVKTPPISVFWQVPQYFIIGCAEVFTNIGRIEFFYEEAPDSLRSLCSALSLSTAALGSYLSSLLVTIVMDISTRSGKEGWISDNLNCGHLHYFFLLLAVLSAVNLAVFVLVAKRYTHKRAVGTLR